MSVANEPEMVGLHDPTQYPPRRPRENPARHPKPDEVGALLGQTRETMERRISHPAPHRSRLDTAAPQFQRRPLETRTSARRGTLFGGTGPLAAAIGVSAVIALLFVTLMPAARQSDGLNSFSAAVGPFAAALSQRHQGEDASKTALAEFQPLLAGNDAAQAAERVPTDARQSDKIVQQFLQWRQKANPSGAAQ